MSDASTTTSVSFGLLLGVISGAWSAIVAFLCVPWYIRLLGIENYGLIGFFVTLQAVIGLLDLGVGATINREVARSVALNDLDHARRLLRSFELIYAGVAVVIAVVIAAAAPLIASYWLKPSALDRNEVETALLLMGIVAALRWPVGLYHGSLIGLHRAQISYRIIAVMTTFANVGAVFILLYGYRTLTAYFCWQAAAAVLYLIWARYSAWHELGGSAKARFDRLLLARLLIKSMMMSGVAITGMVLAQIDKFVVSASINLADFGRYSLAAVIASGLSILFIPTFNLIYPRLSALSATGEAAETIRFYRLGTRLFGGVLFPIAFSASFYSHDLLAFWTGNSVLAAQTAPIAAILFLGSALNGIMHFPYALQLAKGQTRLPFLINCALVAVMVPLTLVLVRQYGSLGGALSWLSMNAIYVVIGVTVTHIYLLPGLQTKWLLTDVAPSILVSGIIVFIGHFLADTVNSIAVVHLMIATVCAITSTASILFIYRDTRAVIVNDWRAVHARRATILNLK